MSTVIEIPLMEPPGGLARPDVTESAARLLKLLADPTRRRLFAALTAGETCNCELSEGLGLAQNLVSHHIRQLREAGFVRERRDESDARWIYFSLNAEALAEAWKSLDALINPAGLRDRTPLCPPPEGQA
jgi:DNA-binding transcriptional ArsR family regulator